MSILDEMDLLSFFESEPVDSDAADGFWCYQVTDAQGLLLRFSFNAIERSVQTVISHNGKPVCSVCYEGATVMRLGHTNGQECLNVDFEDGESKATLQLSWKGGIRCVWSSLQGHQT